MESERNSQLEMNGVRKLETQQRDGASTEENKSPLRLVKDSLKRILVVDDEELLRDVLKETFQDAGYQVDEAENGRTAFKMITEKGYDCVVSDIRMPGGDGFELAQNVFNLGAKAPKMFLITGFSEVTLEKAKDFGVLHIFEKPFDIKKLLVAIDEAIGSGLKSGEGSNPAA